MITPDFRALCAEMLEAFDGLPCETNYKGQSRTVVDIDEDLFARARTALAEPTPPAPAPVAVPVPVAVSERLPEPEECTAQGWCWVLYRNFPTWSLEPPLGQDGKHTGYTHWLPAHAIPLPQAGEVEG